MNLRRYRGGEVWTVAAVDERLLDAALVADAARQRATWVPDPELEVGRIETWQPESWSHESCGGTAVHVWDGESRVRVTSGFTARQRAAVRIQVEVFPGLVAACSGAMLNDRWVLTAAHCVRNPDGSNKFDVPADVGVTSVTPEQVVADDVVIPDPYNASSIDRDYDDDWALIHLATPWQTPLTDMDLWSGSDEAFTDIGPNVRMVGYPSDVLNSNDNCVAGDTDLFGSSDALVMATPAKRVKLKADSSEGQSGAPWYFCPVGPDDSCDGDEEGEIVAVHGGFNSLEERQVGAKASSFRPEAVSVMQNWTGP